MRVDEAIRVKPVRLFCGLIGRDRGFLEAVIRRLVERFGPLEAASGWIPFDFTDYYREEMGEPLFRRFVAFGPLVDPAVLPDVKRWTNELEAETAERGDGRPRRRVNLDPGYLTADKLVLATTKNFSHRIYLRDGIYAEVTLNFTRSGCRFFDWTYPDFRTPAYTAFFMGLRERLLRDDRKRSGAVPETDQERPG